MAVIVEDGSIVANSDSYVTRAEYIAYALSIGIVINSDATADVELIKAAEYIKAHEVNLKGDLVERAQSMAYPRANLWINGFSWSSEEIPTQVKNCQMSYALLIHTGEDLYNRSPNPNQVVKREKIDGAVEVEYEVPVNGNSTALTSSAADAQLDVLLKSNAMTFELIRQ